VTADFPRIVELARAALPDPWSDESFRAELDRPGGRIWVARASDQAGAQPAGFLIAYRIKGELHVLSLAVQPESRRLGIGRVLVRAALQEAWSADLDVAHLEVNASNDAAIALYESVGFEAVGIRRRYYRDGEDAVLMTLFLNRADVRPRARLRESIE
jgi:ribosomal-protein-alanine acetyltransferase